MRESLKRSKVHSPDQQFEKYPAGSVILCNACTLPVFKLDKGIALGDGAGKAAAAFKPLTLADLGALVEREDIDAGVRARLRSMTPKQRIELIEALCEVRAGEPMLCPVCHDCFAQVIAVDKHEVLDKAYTVELLMIPPPGVGRPAPLRGKRLGANGEWLH